MTKNITSTTSTTSTSSSTTSSSFFNANKNDNSNMIMASDKYDPGLRDIFNCVKNNIDLQKGEQMHNLNELKNDGYIISDDPIGYPATDHVFEIKASYNLKDCGKRNYVLIIEDMEIGYKTYINHCIPKVKQLIDTFRELDLPIVWTNWSRRFDDGLHNAIDRFYGSQGIDEQRNPCYVYGKDANETVQDLAPKTENEKSRTIHSLHLSKFADVDEDGKLILFSMLEMWGVNTIILCGAWTDDCIAATAMAATDQYGYDCILINDGCATATVNGSNMMKALYSSVAKEMSTNDVIGHLKNNPDLIDVPKAPLNGNIYKQYVYNDKKLS